MATTRARGAWRKAPLTAESPDAEARALAATPQLTAALDAARTQASKSGGTITEAELDGRRPITPVAEPEAEDLLKQWEDEDAAQRRQPPARGARRGSVARQYGYRPRGGARVYPNVYPNSDRTQPYITGRRHTRLRRLQIRADRTGH